jgi:molecular chaperone DnaJ
MASRKDYYDILGIQRGATEEEIEKAYQKLARTYQYVPHPGNKTVEFRFREILEAYEVLSNKARRERYDRMGVEIPLPRDFWGEDVDEMEGEEGSSFEGFEDVLEIGFEIDEAKGVAARGRDLPITLQIEFESAIIGTVKEIQVSQEFRCLACGAKGINLKGPQEICGQCGGAGQVQIGLPPSAFSRECSRCQGAGRVPTQHCEFCAGKGWVSRERSVFIHIPPGVDDDCRIYLLNMGHTGNKGETRGDLVADIRVKKHPYFQRKGDDLYLEVPLTIWEAILGAEVEVPTLDGSAKIIIPKGAQPGDQLRIPEQGAPSLLGEGRGDLVISVKILVPQEVDENCRTILEVWKQKDPADPRQGCGWWLKS